MAQPPWRVEFDRDAARELRKLGSDAQHLILRYLRERIAVAGDPRRFGHALTGDLKGALALSRRRLSHCRVNRRQSPGGADRYDRPSARNLSLSAWPQSGEKHLHRYLAEFDFRYNNRSAFGITETPNPNTLRPACSSRIA